MILKSLGNISLVKNLINTNSKQKEKWQIGLFLASLFFLIIAYSNPQWGQKKETSSLRQADVVFALDVSKSMLAQDVLPNRLTRAKAFALKLIEQIKAERIGLITFAENAYIQMPLTADYASAKMYLEAADTEAMTSQGTSVENALAEVSRIRTEDKSKPLVLILISDGESHEDTGINEAENLVEQNILFYCLGVGTSEGGFMTEASSIKKDENGNPIRTKLNESILQQIAASANGKYYNINELSDKTISSISNEIKNIGKEGSSLHIYNDLESRYQYFLILALILLSINIYISRK